MYFIKTARSIFRNEAVERYRARQDASVYPKLMSSHGLPALWVALTLLIAAGLQILSIKIPFFAFGTAISCDQDRLFIILIPANDAHHMAIGKEVRLESNKGNCQLRAYLTEIGAVQISPEMAVEQFGITGKLLSGIKFPLIAVHARGEVTESNTSCSNGSGIRFQAKVRVGSRRVFYYLYSNNVDVDYEL